MERRGNGPGLIDGMTADRGGPRTVAFLGKVTRVIDSQTLADSIRAEVARAQDPCEHEQGSDRDRLHVRHREGARFPTHRSTDRGRTFRGGAVYADSAYMDKQRNAELAKRGVRDRIVQKRVCGQDELTDEQKRHNRE